MAPEEHTEIIFAGDVDFADIPAILGMIAGRVAPPPPRRGSPAHQEAITEAANAEQMDAVIHALHVLWQDYGWRGPLDLMTEWVIQMEHHPNTNSACAMHDCRDLLGVVNLRRLVSIELTEEARLRHASVNAGDPEFRLGMTHSEAFETALELGERATSLATAWMPAYRAALQAAHDHRAAHGGPVSPEARRIVFASLVRGPGRTDPQVLLQAALILGTAAMAVRNREAITKGYVTLETKDARFVDSRDVNPRWRAKSRD